VIAMAVLRSTRDAVLDSFELRCWVHKLLELIQEAVDVSQQVAADSGLVEAHGQDVAQRVVADSFSRREGVFMDSRTNANGPPLPKSLAEHDLSPASRSIDFSRGRPFAGLVFTAQVLARTLNGDATSSISLLVPGVGRSSDERSLSIKLDTTG
jgi:hypothetical protein